MPEVVVVELSPEVKVVKSKVEDTQPEIVFAVAAVVGVELSVLTCVVPSVETPEKSPVELPVLLVTNSLVELPVELLVKLPVLLAVDSLVELPVELSVELPV